MSVDIYNELGERLEAAFTAFRRQHELMHPVPDKPTNQARRDIVFRGLLLIVVLAGMLVSGSRTIVIFAIGKSLVIGGAGVVMLEGAAVVMSYYYTRETYRNRDIDSNYIRRYLRFGSMFAVVVMCSGNTQDVLQIDGFASGNLWVALSLPIAISVALAAPIMVYIAGHVLAMLSVQDASSDRRANLEYQEQMTAWNDELMRSWQANKGRWGAAVNVSVEPVGRTADTDTRLSGLLSVRTDADGQRTDSGHGYARSSNAKEIVRQWLTEHPEDITAQVRELAARLNVGKSTVSDVQREFKGNS